MVIPVGGIKKARIDNLDKFCQVKQLAVGMQLNLSVFECDRAVTAQDSPNALSARKGPFAGLDLALSATQQQTSLLRVLKICSVSRQQQQQRSWCNSARLLLLLPQRLLQQLLRSQRPERLCHCVQDVF